MCRGNTITDPGTIPIDGPRTQFCSVFFSARVMGLEVLGHGQVRES